MFSLKHLVKSNFTSFSFFYFYLGYRMPFGLAISLVIGVLDGFGLAMFIPLLQLVSESEASTSEGLGNLSFLVKFLQNIGLSLNLVTVLAVLTAFFVLKGIISYLGNVYQVWLKQYFMRELRLSALNDFNNIAYKSYVQTDMGRIQNTFTGETERITIAFIHYFRSLKLSILLLVYVGFAIFIDMRFAFLVSLGGILTNFLFKIIYNLSRKESRSVTKDNHVFQGLMIQYISNFKYLKATGFLSFYAEKIRDTIVEIEDKNKKLGVYAAIMGASREPIMIIIISLVILLQTQVLNAPLAPILISLLFFYRALSSLNTLQATWNLFIKFAGSLENMVEFRREIRAQREVKGEKTFREVQSFIELKDVSFSYGQSKVLEGINLKIKKNEVVAFVGESGSGKTTLISILAGLIPPDKGSFLIDGEDVSEFDVETYQSRIGFITQDPTIFNDSIFNNVTFWGKRSPEVEKTFWRVLEQASIDEFVKGLPARENSVLGNNGINLSGGQKQRISIARELFKDIDILIMDEATSALDSETEQSIQQNIEALKGNYTMLIVAHRLSTIRNADRIVLMDKGKVLNMQPFDVLISEEEKFQKMVKLQKI